MNTISWTKRTIGILSVAMAIAACSSDKSNPAADGGTDAGAKCGNGKIEGTEQCDTKDFGSATCSSATSAKSPTGSLACSATCQLVTTGCTSAVGTGGITGAGGVLSTGGTTSKSKDGGADAADAESGGTTGSGGATSTGGTKDSGKD
jgi:hypothetical protein